MIVVDPGLRFFYRGNHFSLILVEKFEKVAETPVIAYLTL